MIYKYETPTATYYFDGEESLKQGIWSGRDLAKMANAFLVLDMHDEVIKNRYNMRILLDMFSSQDVCAVKPLKGDV